MYKLWAVSKKVQSDALKLKGMNKNLSDPILLVISLFQQNMLKKLEHIIMLVNQ
jgi:hypothetical protein